MTVELGELLPCPFCGGEVEIFTRDVKDEFGIYMNEWDIVCKNDSCYLSRKGKTVEQSIKAWNTRKLSEGAKNVISSSGEISIS